MGKGRHGNLGRALAGWVRFAGHHGDTLPAGWSMDVCQASARSASSRSAMSSCSASDFKFAVSSVRTM